MTDNQAAILTGLVAFATGTLVSIGITLGALVRALNALAGLK